VVEALPEEVVAADVSVADDVARAAANNLAWNYAEHGKDLDGAFLLANKSLVKDPENPEYADTLGWILYKKGSYKLALVLLQQSSERFEHKNPSVLYHLGMTYHRQGDKSLARDTLTKSLLLDRSFAGADDAAPGKFNAYLRRASQPISTPTPRAKNGRAFAAQE
jgi:tetratricopeptide (TPR) repeat protein